MKECVYVCVYLKSAICLWIGMCVCGWVPVCLSADCVTVCISIAFKRVWYVVCSIIFMLMLVHYTAFFSLVSICTFINFHLCPYSEFL